MGQAGSRRDRARVLRASPLFCYLSSSSFLLFGFLLYFCVFRVSCLCSDSFYNLLPRRIWCFINGKFFFNVNC